MRVWKPRKYFKHVSDPEVVTELLLVCRLLGRHGDLVVLVDAFLEFYHESAVYQLSALLIINEMILGSSGRKSSMHIILDKKEKVSNIFQLTILYHLY